MKKLILFFFATMLIAGAISQTLTIRFSGRSSIGTYVRMDSVKIENFNRSWVEHLIFPDTVLRFNLTGIEDVSANKATLKAYPNPFNGKTNLNLQISNSDNVTLQIFNLAGQKVAECSQNLEAGNYIFDINLKNPQVYLAILSTSQGQSTTKLINRAENSHNFISVKAWKPITEKMISTQTFQIGDVLRYTGFATINGQRVTSTQVYQSQDASENITLFFPSPIILPSITTDSVINISDTSATCYANVIANGNATLTACGICYSTSPNPTTSENIVPANVISIGSFHCNITNLTANTTYYTRAYVTNSIGTSYGSEKNFTTFALPIVTIDTITNITDTTAICQGNVTFDGNTNIISRGFCYSTSPNPTINDSVVLANTNDTGTYTCTLQNLIDGTVYYVRAYAINSVGVTYGVEKTFTPLVAGCLYGKFSIAANRQIRFSKGNLQWSATGTHTTLDSTAAGTWRFAEHQWDTLGILNSNISSSYTGWINQFGWGTSGYNNKYPYMTSTDPEDYGNGTNNLDSTNYDWGVYNAISNGGNTPNLWRTLTIDEWIYLFNTRNASTINGTDSVRYAFVKVNGIYGILLFPDTFAWPNRAGTAPTNFNTPQGNWNGVNYTIAQFTVLEQAGVVFIPTESRRSGNSSRKVQSDGLYWSSTSYSDPYTAYYINFYPLELLSSVTLRDNGHAVRLVRNAN